MFMVQQPSASCYERFSLLPVSNESMQHIILTEKRSVEVKHVALLRCQPEHTDHGQQCQAQLQNDKCHCSASQNLFNAEPAGHAHVTSRASSAVFRLFDELK